MNAEESATAIIQSEASAAPNAQFGLRRLCHQSPPPSNSPGNDRLHHRHYHRRHFLSAQHSSNDPLNYSSIGPWEDSYSGNSMPPAGRKRHFSHFAQGTSSDFVDWGDVVKLYVGGVPRTATEEVVRSVFSEHGNVVEVILLKDKWSGQQQEYCFVKFATLEEANQAISKLNDQYTFSGGLCPIKVRYADGERERLEKKGMFRNTSAVAVSSTGQKSYGCFGDHTMKLYVGCVNKQASRREIEEIFLPYGDVEDIYIVRDEMKQQRGCAFVQFSRREMAIAAINALHGTYIMRGCEQPLIVRFADPKKPRGGDSRAAPHIRDRMVGHAWPNDFHTTGDKPQSVTCAHTASDSVLPSSSSSCNAVSTSSEGSDYVDCDWSEHICPDGYLYYYNCVTCESRWEKPEEYALYEQQLLKLDKQQQHISHPQVLSSIEVSEAGIGLSAAA